MELFKSIKVANKGEKRILNIYFKKLSNVNFFEKNIIECVSVFGVFCLFGWVKFLLSVWEFVMENKTTPKMCTVIVDTLTTKILSL